MANRYVILSSSTRYHLKARESTSSSLVTAVKPIVPNFPISQFPVTPAKRPIQYFIDKLKVLSYFLA